VTRAANVHPHAFGLDARLRLNSPELQLIFSRVRAGQYRRVSWKIYRTFATRRAEFRDRCDDPLPDLESAERFKIRERS